MSKTTIDGDLVRALAALLDETGLTEIEYDAEGVRLRVARQAIAMPMHAPAPHVAAAPVAAAPVSLDPANHPGAVPSPMVGVAYLRPEPDKPAFVNIGDTVTEGQTLMLIEAMKTFNPIRAPRGGRVSQILVSDGHAVEFGEPLLILE